MLSWHELILWINTWSKQRIINFKIIIYSLLVFMYNLNIYLPKLTYSICMVKTIHKNITESSSQSVFAMIEKPCSDKKREKQHFNQQPSHCMFWTLAEMEKKWRIQFLSRILLWNQVIVLNLLLEGSTIRFKNSNKFSLQWNSIKKLKYTPQLTSYLYTFFFKI